MDKMCIICQDPFVASDERPDSPMCDDCGRMIGGAAKKREASRGSGGIQGVNPDGTWIQYDKTDEMRLLAEWSDPEFDYHEEDEQRFNDIDLMRLSYWRLRKALNKKGFTDMPDEDLEDGAQDVCVSMLRGLESGVNIESIHGYHWGTVNGVIKGMMEKFVEHRMANVAADVIDIAEALGIRDPYNYGSVESLYEHEKKEPLWTRFTVGELDITFGKQGIHLTQRELTTLRNAITGENKGLYGSTNTKRVLNSIAHKIRENSGGEQAWQEIKEMIDG